MNVPRRTLLVVAGVVLAAVALAQASYSITVNGKAAKVESFVKDGVLYVNAAAFAKALGATLTFDKSRRVYAVSSPAGAPAAVAGTAQLAGGVGEVGKTYTIKGNNSLINFTVTRLEYVAGHFVAHGDDLIRPDVKYLVVYATVQDPLKADEVGANQVRMSVVDSANRTVDPSENWYDVRTGEAAFVDLKPGQKLDVFTYFELRNEASAPKLIVRNGDQVVRYDLKGKVKPLPAPFVDPAGADGSVAREVLPGAVGAAFTPGFGADGRVDAVAFSSGAVGGVEVPDGGRLLVVNFTLRGTEKKPVSFGGYNVKLRLRDADGAEREPDAVLLGSRDADFDVSVAAGQSVSGRAVFRLDAGVKPQALRFSFGDAGGSRPVEIDLSGLK